MQKKSLIVFLFIFVVGSYMFAQDKYTIYPTPQQQIISKGKTSFTSTVNVVAESDIDDFTRNRIEQILNDKGLNPSFVQKPKAGLSTIYLGINGSNGSADRMASKLKLNRDVFNNDKYDRHIVSLTNTSGKATVVVLGENTDAVFYGLATVEQILDNGADNLNCVTIYDYADVQYRGVIEGYYGVPYSKEVTEDLFRFMARYKLNTYMYGAKSDPYHSRYWDKPYPAKISEKEKRFGLMTAQMMEQLCKVAHESKVNFIWSIHPGQTFTSPENPDVLDRIMSKFDLMYNLGVRQFGVFVDDVGVPYDSPSLELCANRLSELQNMVDAKWNKEGTKPSDMVKPLQYVPQLYAYSWVKPELAQKFWESLRPVPEKVNIYTTGKNVWSVPNNTDLAVLNNYLGREVAWWWNYPCNDVDVTKIFIGDTYTNFSDETHIDSNSRLEEKLSLNTLIINPMQQGELSKIPLFSLGDYTWNMSQFNNMNSWRASLDAVVGDIRAKTLEYLVPYLRYYDHNSKLAKLIDEFKQAYSSSPDNASAKDILLELDSISFACDIISQMSVSKSQSDSLFYADIRPWVAKLKSMADNGKLMLKALTDKKNTNIDRITFAKGWSAIEGIDKADNHRFDILTGMGSDISLSVKTAEPAAESLRPFLDWILQQLELSR